MNRPTVGHVREDQITIYIGRSNQGDAHIRNTPPGKDGWLGNPYPTSEYSRQRSIGKFADLLDSLVENKPRLRVSLAHIPDCATLGCFCRQEHESEPACHGDVLAQRINDLRPDIRESCGDHEWVKNAWGMRCCKHCYLSSQGVGWSG